ncbi:MAG: acetyl-CoA carboxylase biotin carboxyl carrier protein [Alphaproteobacteria bacterium]
MPSPKASAPKTSAPAVEANSAIDTSLVRKLADILKDSGLTEIEVAQGDLKIRISRTATAINAAPVSYAVPDSLRLAAEAPPAALAAKSKGDAVKSPMVGTVYLQPQPEAPMFIKAGDTVAEGQTLLIIEAMKTMNPIPAPRSGKIVEVLVVSGQAVEFGEPIVVIE